jgi:hypothetical protein
MCNSNEVTQAYAIVTFQKEPMLAIPKCICLKKEEALKARKRFSMEDGLNSNTNIYRVPFLDPNDANRSRPHDHTLDDGNKVAYIVSEIFESHVIQPVLISSKYEEAAKEAEDLGLEEFQIDLVEIINA